MINIKLLVDVKIIQETLSRLGVCNWNTQILYPSAYLISLEGQNYIAHFKELFKYINKDAFENFTEQDKERLNSIVWLLEKWGLVESCESLEPHSIKVDTIRFDEKKNWLIKNKIKIKNIEAILA